jgi:2-C-methyl-D-erythritol 4-phosphate cytidylyltransferase
MMPHIARFCGWLNGPQQIYSVMIVIDAVRCMTAPKVVCNSPLSLAQYEAVQGDSAPS